MQVDETPKGCPFCGVGVSHVEAGRTVDGGRLGTSITARVVFDGPHDEGCLNDAPSITFYDVTPEQLLKAWNIRQCK